jgi:hypothetical protein
MAWIELTVKETAASISSCLSENAYDDAIRLAFRIHERYQRSSVEAREQMIKEQPNETGDPRFDALIAGIVEYSCAVNRVGAPKWTQEEKYFLGTFWFVSGLESLHADAFVSSPISCKRRGVFLTQDSLTYA